MKHKFYFFLAAICCMMMPFGKVNAKFQKNGVYYEYTNGQKSLVVVNEHGYVDPEGGKSTFNYRDLDGIVDIPDHIDGLPVVIIRQDAFVQAPNDIIVTCPSTLTDIETGAFTNSAGLKSITMNEGLTEIKKGVFFECKNLVSVYVPKSVKAIRSYAFISCESLPEIDLANVTSIGDNAFNFCFSLTTVNGGKAFPVVTIGRRAFAACKSLRTIKFADDKLISIGEQAFMGCKSLETLTLPESLQTIGDEAFAETGLKVLYNNNPTPQKIKANVFRDVDFFHCVLYVPKGSKSAYKAHEVWSKFGQILEPGEIPAKMPATGLTVIDGITYYLNQDLTATIIADKNTQPKGKLVLPSVFEYKGFEYTLVALDRGALWWKDELTEIVIPNTVASIGEEAFYGCKNLQSVTLPTTLKSIGQNAFRKCQSLKNITLPSTLELLADGAFRECSSLTSVTIPASITELGWGVFNDCTNLSSVTLPSTLTTIGVLSFGYCENLKSIVIPASVTKIKDNAFWVNDYGLTSIIMEAKTPPVTSSTAFSKYVGIYDKCIVDVPEGCVEKYKDAETWKNFANIREKGKNEKIKSGDLYYQLIENGTAYVTCEKNESGNYSGLTGEVTIKNSITNDGLEYKVTYVGPDAFRYATGITKVNLPKDLDSICGHAFSGCTKLAEINLPSTLTSLSGDAFEGTQLLTDKEDANGAVYHDGCLLALAKQLPADYTVKAGTRLIASKVFRGQNSITSLTLPEGVKVLCDEALCDMPNLKTISLPSTLWRMDNYSFLNNCTSLTAIYNFKDQPYNELDINSFKGLDKKACTLYVPKGCKGRYESTDVWKDFPITEMSEVQFTVTFVDYDGLELKSVVVEYGKDATAPDDPVRNGYTFTGWDKNFSNVQSDLTVTAQYEIKKFTVIFLDWDDSPIDSQEVAYGDAAVAPKDPERGGYTFLGWDKEFDIVTEALSVKAQYALKVWTVTYLNWDGELLGTEEVKDGEDAEGMVATKIGWYFDYWYNTKNFEKVDLKNITSNLTVKAQFTYEVTFTVTYRVDGVTTFEMETVYGYDASKIYYNPKDSPKPPVRESTEEYDYTFVGWTPEVSYVTSNIVLEAVFEATPRKYTVSFYDWDDKLIKEETVEYGKPAIAPDDPVREGFTFTGWDKSFGLIKSDLSVKAQYELQTFSVTFVDWDDVVLRSAQIVNYGSDAVPPADPIRTGYTFTGWDVAYKNVTSDLTVKAVYEINKYTVRFFEQDGKTQIGENQTINWNEAATAPEEKDIPAVEGYHFTGWDTEFDHVKADLDIKAVYEINKYTVTFIDWDEKVLKSESVEHGSAATAPEDPTRADYTFTGWDKAFDNITADLTVQAQYELATVYFTVTYYDWDLTILGTEKVEEGKDAKGLDPEPTREGYTFTGWSKPLTNITSDLSVQAQYEVAKVYFTVTYYDWDLTLLGTEQVEEGKDAQGLNPEPTREGYTFTGWSKPLTNITSDLSVQAQYEEIVEVDYTPQNLKAALLEQNDDVMITLSWDKVDGAASYELRVAIGENELFSQNTMTLNVISSLLSTIEKEYQLTPGTFTIDWFVRSTDGMGNPISDWAQGESFEVTIKDTGTGLDEVNSQKPKANSQKILIDGVLYIRRNGHLFDAQGQMVK